MPKLAAFGVLLLCVAFAAAQDTTNTGGQAGSVTGDATATTPPPTTTAPPTTAAPPSPPSGPQVTAMPPWVNPAAPAPGAPQNPVGMTPSSMSSSSGSGSFGNIVSPVTKKPKRTVEAPSTPTPSEDNGVPVLATNSACAIAVLAGLAALL